ncbi:MAG: rhodanese-like domain-containing protein [Syntrophobacteraceae bacterium]
MIAVVSLFLTGTYTGTAAQQIQQGQAPKDERKQTSIGKYATALEAYLMYRANPEKIAILDVRTPEEYSLVGHAPAAVNIPSMLWTGRFDAGIKDYPLADNPGFEAAVKSRFKPDDIILVMCRSGNRSAAAVELLAKAGFKNLYNVTDGFEGDRITEEDSYSKGKRLKNGWRNSGVPWTTDLDPKLVYMPSR